MSKGKFTITIGDRQFKVYVFFGDSITKYSVYEVKDVRRVPFFPQKGEVYLFDGWGLTFPFDDLAEKIKSEIKERIEKRP